MSIPAPRASGQGSVAPGSGDQAAKHWGMTELAAQPAA